MPSLDLLRMDVTTTLPITGRQWLRLVEHTLDGDGVPGSCAIALILIGRSGGGMHQVSLAEKLGVTGPTLVRKLDQLTAAGLVRREADRHNRRANTLWLNDSGIALAERLERKLTALRRRVLKSFSRTDLELIVQLQQTIANAVADLEAIPTPDGKHAS
jgi:MarR family transcriptional regulator for hemolysin